MPQVWQAWCDLLPGLPHKPLPRSGGPPLPRPVRSRVSLQCAGARSQRQDLVRGLVVGPAATTYPPGSPTPLARGAAPPRTRKRLYGSWLPSQLPGAMDRLGGPVGDERAGFGEQFRAKSFVLILIQRLVLVLLGRQVLYSSDALGGKPAAHSLELDCDLGLNATFLHGPPFPKPSVSTGCLGRGKGYAGGPEGWTAGAGQSWQGITSPRADPALTAAHLSSGPLPVDASAAGAVWVGLYFGGGY
jgi:hypothetical protein